jgi:CO/xanthine dehydrogenase Mo-binding subunit
VLVSRPGAAPASGAGEVTAAVIPAALVNAVAAVTGVWVRELSLTG